MIKGNTTYFQVSEKLLKGMRKARPKIQVFGGRTYRVSESLHRTPQARAARAFWRLKYRRMYGY
jgi:hypothetical protein